MASLHTSAFTRPALLERVEPALLQRFLRPHRSFLAARGFSLETTPDLDALAGILMDPGPDCPRTLLDALFCIGEMSLPAAADALQNRAERSGVVLKDEETPLELALRVWMTDPEALLNAHAERAMLKVRSFQYFSSLEEDEPPLPTEGALSALERSLDIWFEAKGRGRGTRVHAYPRGSEIWFLVRRGDLFRREVALEAGERRTLGFRPEKYDVVVFNQLTNELGINAKTPAIRDCYRKQFGFHLFGRDNQFGGAEKYTLEPLRELGEQALNVLDVPGIRWVRLTELRYLKDGPEPAVMTCASEDVFAHMRSTGGPIQPEWMLKRATFKVRFDDNPTPRSVTVKPSNVALYSRDADATAVEEWLTRRGFIQQEMICGSEQQEMPLRGAR
jgi:hypothetical protein